MIISVCYYDMHLSSKKIAERDKKQNKAKADATQAVEELVKQWEIVSDNISSLEKEKVSLRASLIASVDELGMGDDTIVVGDYTVSAKEIKGSDYVDGNKLRAELKGSLSKYAAMVLKEEVSYTVNETKLVQLVERGLIPAKIIVKCSSKKDSRGTRLSVSRISKRKARNET